MTPLSRRDFLATGAAAGVGLLIGFYLPHRGARAAEVFAPNAAGVLSHIWQVSPGGGWSGWVPLTGTSGNRPSVGVLPDKRLEVFAVDAD